MRRTLPVVIAVVTGFAVLLVYFFPLQNGAVQLLRRWVFTWAALLASVALLVGVLNLVRAHGDRILTGKGSWWYSIVLLLGLFGVLMMYLPVFMLSVVRILAPGSEAIAAIEGPAGQAGGAIQFVFDYVQTPIEAALGGLLAVILLLAGWRLMRNRRNAIGAGLFLLFAIMFLGCAFFSPALYAWLSQVVALGGARGILLGMALGAAATGLRVILGTDQPYAE